MANSHHEDEPSISYEPPSAEAPLERDLPFELLTEEQKIIRLAVDALFSRLRF